MSFNQYDATHKTWNHVGIITPNVEYSEPVRPAGDFMPADWLPVGRQDLYHEEYFTVSAGKIIAFDRQGRVVPAGLKTAFVAGGTALTYTAADVAAGVISLATGVTCTAGAVTNNNLTTALRLRGLIEFDETAQDFVSYPVGVAPYNYYSWAGGDGLNPSGYVKHNHNLQHRVAILTKYVVEMPLMPAVETGINLAGSAGIVNTAVDDWAEDNANGAWYSNTALQLTTRWATAAALNTDTVALVLPQQNIAFNCSRTPFVITGTAINAMFVTEVASIAELTATGRYFIDYDVGAILFYESGGNAALGGGVGTLTYFSYDTALAVPVVGTYACAIGDLKPGDFVRADLNSNFIKANVITDTEVETCTSEDPETSLSSVELACLLNLCAKRQDEIIGQVLELEDHPRDYLDRVRTAYPSLGTQDQMPGTATAGQPTAVTYAGAANRMVRILLLK